MSIERDGRSDRTVDSALVAPRSPHRVAACGERLLFGRKAIDALGQGRELIADLPPDKFFADAGLIATVIGKRRGR